MRVLATVQPGHGHLNPVVPLCRALVSAGHHVSVACSPSFTGQVRALGLEAVAVGPAWTWAEPEQLLGRQRASSPAEHARAQRDAAEVSRFAMLSELRGTISDLGVDLVVHEQYEPAGALAAELSGTPCLCLGHGYSPFVAAAARVVPAHPVRRTLGLPDRPDQSWTYAYADTCPSWLHPFPPATSPQRFVLRPQGLGGSAETPGAHPGDDHVAIVLGTTRTTSWRGLRPVVQAAASSGRTVLVMGVREPPPPDLLALEDVSWLGFSELAPLLRRCAVAVTQGGWGTTLAAVRAGVPVLVLPEQDEQRYLAFRLHGAGAGLTLPCVPSRTAVSTVLDRLLREPLFRANAQRLAADIGAMPDAGTVLDRLVRLVGRAATGAGVR